MLLGIDPITFVYAAIGLFIVLILWIFLSLIRMLHLEILDVRKDIRESVVPNFIDISPESNELFDLAVEVWKLEHRISKILPSIPENQRKNLENSVQKLKRYLEKNDVEIVDYTNQKFNDGRNLDVLAVEKDPAISEPKVKETREPTILHKGQVVRRGKVIIVSKE